MRLLQALYLPLQYRFILGAKSGERFSMLKEMEHDLHYWVAFIFCPSLLLSMLGGFKGLRILFFVFRYLFGYLISF